MKSLDAAAVGPSDLEQKMDDFGEEWDYGFEQLGEFAGSAVDALQAIASAFDEAEAKLTEALNGAKAEG